MQRERTLTATGSTSVPGQLPPFDDYGKRPSERLLYLGTCRIAKSHDSARAAVQPSADEWQISSDQH